MYCFNHFTYIFRFINSYLNSSFFPLSSTLSLFIEQLKLSSLQKNQTKCSACVGLWPPLPTLCTISNKLLLFWPTFSGLSHRSISEPPTQRQGWVPLISTASPAPNSEMGTKWNVAAICWMNDGKKNMVTFLPGSRGLCGSDN